MAKCVATTLAAAIVPLASGMAGLAVVGAVTVMEAGTSREERKANLAKTVTMISCRQEDRTLHRPRQDGFATATGFLDAALI
jgi:hypothetical protein